MEGEAKGTASSSDTAVVVRTLWAEYTWLRQNAPDVSVVSRREMWEGNKLFDILTVKSDVGDSRDIYFDVTACFSERQPTRPCPYCGEPLTTVKAKQCGLCFADFHDLSHVIFRKGLDHVDRVRERATRRRELEASPPGLADPWTAFAEQCRPTEARGGVFVLRCCSRLSTLDERLFRIGVDRLLAEGCRGVVCHVDQAPNGDWQLKTELRAIALHRIVLLWRRGLRVVLVGGANLTELPAPVVLESYETEDEAVARVAAQLSSRDQG
jgi:hypothetical protein